MKAISQIEKEFSLLAYLATDRNVMNLPGIGKSMTFNLVAIMPDGCRLVAFSHDNTRRHSPVISHMPIVYIKEDKSLAEYMRQLSDIDEKNLRLFFTLEIYFGQDRPHICSVSLGNLLTKLFKYSI